MFQVPGGPAYTQLEPGDVLVHVNGEVSYEFSHYFCALISIQHWLYSNCWTLFGILMLYILNCNQCPPSPMYSYTILPCAAGGYTISEIGNFAR